MAGERVDSFTEAKELYREHRHPRPETVLVPDAPDVPVGAMPHHAVAGTGMDGIAADFDQLRQAERELAALHDSLVDHLRAATDLSGPLGDGSSPVTGPMRRAFAEHADPETGVQGALLDYLEELVAVRVAILDTLATYEQADGEAVARLDRQLANLDREVD